MGNIYIFFRNMAREIALFVILSLDPSGLDFQQKGIYTYRKDHMAESMVFSPRSRTVIPFPSLLGKIQAYQVRITRHWHGIKDMPSLISLPYPSLSVNIPQGRPELDGLTGGKDLT